MSDAAPAGAGIDPATWQAYAETEYRVEGPAPLVLRIGQAHAGLAAYYVEHGVDCAAYLTACNPYSRRLADAENAARAARLREALLRAGRTFVAGAGVHPRGGWPAEPSLLVPGLPLDAACALGRRFEQHAIVWCGPDAVPRLVALGADPRRRPE